MRISDWVSSARSFRRYSLRAKLVIAFVAIALIPFLLLVYLDDRYTRVTLTDNANQALLAAASQTALRVDSFINNNLNAIGTEAQLPDFVAYLSVTADRQKGSAQEAEAISALYALSRKDEANISAYALLDRQGQTLIGTFTPEIGADRSGDDYFQLAVKTGMPYASPVEFPETGMASIYFSGPVRATAAGEIIGVLYARYNAGVLEQIIVQSGELAGPQSFAVLLDENHVRLAHGTNPGLIYKALGSLDPAHAAELQANRRLPRQPLKELATNLPAFEQGLLNAEKQPYFTAYFGNTDNELNSAAVARLTTKPWVVVFAQPQAVFLAPIQQQSRMVLLLGLVCAVLVIAAAMGIAQWLTRPVAHLTAMARQVTGGNLDARARVESADEIGVLAKMFNSMTCRLAETLEGLRASEENYRGIFENAAEGIYSVSIEGKLLSANPAIAHILAFQSPAEMITHLTDVRKQLYVHPQERDHFLSAILEHGIVSGQEFQFYRHDRQIIWVSVSARLVRDPAGQPLYMEGILTDITGHKQAEENIARSLQAEKRAREIAEILREANESLSRTLNLEDVLNNLLHYLHRLVPYDSANVMLLEDDFQLRVTALRGYDRWTDAEQTRQLVFDWRTATALNELMTKQKSVLIADTREYPGWSRPAGTEHVISWLGVPIIANGQVIGLYSVDKTQAGFFTEEHLHLAEGLAGQAAVSIQNTRLHDQIKRANAELEQRVIERTGQLQAAANELETLSYTVSHNLRAPLRHIDGFLELFQRQNAATLDEQSHHYLATISSAARYMGELTDDLLTFLHLGRHLLTIEPVNLNGLLQEVIGDLEPETRAHRVNWRIAELPMVTGDRAMLRIVFVNLISNALKFTRARAETEIEIGYENRETEAVIFVRDNGVGFDMQYADKLFGVFQRLHRADEYEGTGIGLANVRRIIMRHGGRTWAEGQVDKGATFYFSLPKNVFAGRR